MGARILFVTGKGGTGKSSIASALAGEAAARGQAALLVRMPDHGRVAGAATQSRPGQVVEKALDDTRDLEDFLTRVIGLGLVARRLLDSRTFAAVAAAAPGLRDLVALAAITSEASRRRGVVVVDAPASGHSVPLLTAPARVRDLAPVGPVAREAREALAALTNREGFAAVLVATPEELAIAEVLALRDDVLAAGVATSRVVINGLWPGRVGNEDGETIAASGASSDAASHWRRHRRQATLADDLEARVGPCSRVGFSFGGSGAALPRADIAALFDALAQDAR